MNAGNAGWRIDLEPVGRRVNLQPGESLLKAAQKAGAGLLAVCGGNGTCFQCRIRVIQGEVSPPTLVEQKTFQPAELAAGWRLACQTFPQSAGKIFLPAESLSAPQRLQVEGQALRLSLHPGIRPLDLILQPPSVAQPRSDEECLTAALKKAGVPPVQMELPVWSCFSDLVRRYAWRVRLALRGDQLVSLLPEHAELYGLAVDLGSTKIAVYLIHLANGELAGSLGISNPQIAYGEDVVSRIDFAGKDPSHRELLQHAVVEALNQELDTLCRKAGILPDQVVDAVVVGNTAMHHLFTGIPVQYLALAPYPASQVSALSFSADQIGLKIAPGGWIYLPPNIAGFVGGDHVAMLLATRAYQAEGTTLALDIGTNTEISLVTRERMLSCSCASGPAFEGARISAGMRAVPGAIERVDWVDGQLRCFTIAGSPPAGICGSGILDLISLLRRIGVLDARGAFQPGQPGVELEHGERCFRLVDASQTKTSQAIYITRRDVNEIQLAKAAIRAGIDSLLQVAEIQAEEIDRVIIAGAFGTYLNVQSAVAIGMFPSLPLERFHQVGNAAGAGACQLLTDAGTRLEAERIARQTEYIELTTLPEFSEYFMNAIGLG